MSGWIIFLSSFLTSEVIAPALRSSVTDFFQGFEPITGSPLPDPKKKKYDTRLVKPGMCHQSFGVGWLTGKEKNVMCLTFFVW